MLFGEEGLEGFLGLLEGELVLVEGGEEGVFFALEGGGASVGFGGEMLEVNDLLEEGGALEFEFVKGLAFGIELVEGVVSLGVEGFELGGGLGEGGLEGLDLGMELVDLVFSEERGGGWLWGGRGGEDAGGCEEVTVEGGEGEVWVC